MSESHYSNAMTEIALALAMAFFSIMILTMLSMGAEFQSVPSVAAAAERLELAPSALPEAGAAGNVTAEETVLLHYDGRFLDTDLRPVDPQTLSAGAAIVLAIDPGLPLAEAVAIRERIPTTGLVVTTLDARWLEALEEASQ